MINQRRDTGHDDVKIFVFKNKRSEVPTCWLGRTMTVDIEAKAKELAVVKLMTELKSRVSQ